MRLWTFHPQYLDRQGLLAVWREALLAQQVLNGATRGYRHHPQLFRFIESGQPLAAIGVYLVGLLREAEWRGYRFTSEKIIAPGGDIVLDETDGQLLFEWRHLKNKLRQRSREQFERISEIKIPQPHPLFKIISGPVKPWEKTAK